ncbi:efflux RND transporter periplasmic adaptor subunit [Terriglobus saanensis]|uniref:Efflux transporter, RND family, MFP subunit n=1 Tax=Terriglobus saanensis (strain ATCC BAA-1853 / DSM 23119 / SP1PR4) TaxID=401053 RepID=E8UWY6_TERSS|nr:efflux RND transporter periplasmic adaptor subunit [Terriglobus saanensis]ADV81873.1 efflux transporter, RND family, MFP subunit [Terriglobus saanensis SP1PR4]
MTEMTPTFRVKCATLLAFCVPLALFSGCKKAADSSDTTTLVTVQAEKPEMGEIAEQIAADATLSPLAQASISPKITAPVHQFFVQRGAHVKKGQLLAILENRDLAATALDNQGQFEAAQATYETQTKAQVPEDFAKAQLDVSQAKAQVNLAGEIAAARKKLFTEGAIPGRDYDTAAAALVQAQATYDVAMNHLHSLQNVSRQSALNQAKGQLTSAKGKYLNAEAQVSYSKIQSPIDGVVTDRPLFPGETVASGSTLITVMDTSSLLAKVHLSQIVAQRLALGDKAAVTIPGVDDKVEATVALVSPALDPGSTTVEVWLKVDNRDGRYKAGTPVRTSITGRSVPKAMKIPLTAILSSQEAGKYVMVAGADGAAHKKTVTLGINDGTDVQVLTGIAPNDAVITTGAYGLDEGTKVKVGAAEEDAK